MPRATEPFVSRPCRPVWVLWVIAFPVGVLLNGLVGDWGNLPSAVMTLMGWLHEPTALQRHATRLVSHLVVPGTLVFLVLKTTPLGAWLAPNRLALGGLLLADGLLAAVALRGFYMASIGEPPFLMGAASALATPVFVASFVIGLGGLLGSTLWHRLVADEARALGLCKRLLREV